MKRFKNVIIEIIFLVGGLSIFFLSAYGLSCIFGKYGLFLELFLLFVFPYSIAEKNERKFRTLNDKVAQLLDQPEYDNLSYFSKHEILEIIKIYKD